MRNKILLTLGLVSTIALAASSFTTNYDLEKPADGDNNFGDSYRSNLDTIDAQLFINSNSISNHVTDTVGAHASTAISTPGGSLACTTVDDVEEYLDCLSDTIGSVVGGTAMTLNTIQTVTAAKTYTALQTFTNHITASFLSTGVVHSDSSGVLTSSQVTDTDVSSSAAIARSKLAIGTVTNIPFNDSSTGLISEEPAFTYNDSTNRLTADTHRAEAALELGDTGGGTNYITIQAGANAALTADYTLTLPNDDGTSNQVLKTDGSGVLSWTSAVIDPTTTKGDLITRDSSVLARLPVGTDTYALAAASSTTTGLQYVPIDQASDLVNLTLTASVGSNALTIALKDKSGSNASSTSPVYIGFRNSTAATGTYLMRSVTGALSVVISSGSTMGHTSAQTEFIYIYAIDNAGTVELAATGENIFDEASRQTTTAEGGAGAADSRNVLYSTTARSNVPIRLIGRMKSNQTTAGTWAALPTEISPYNNQLSMDSELLLNGFTGYGSTNTVVLRFTTSTSSGLGATTYTYTASASNGDSITINESGLYSMSAIHASANNTSDGLAITKNAITGITGTAAANRICGAYTGLLAASPIITSCSGTIRLNPGDIIRVTTEAASTPTTTTYDQIRIVKVSP